jgi:transposase
MTLTPEQWSRVQPLLPPPPSPGQRGHPALDQRLILEGILLKLATRISWRRVPFSCAPWQTCYQHYLLWKENGILRRVIKALLKDVEERGRFYLRRPALQGHVTMEQHGRRLRVYVSTAIAPTWQLSTAILYYQYAAALVELKRGITATPDPLVEILGFGRPLDSSGFSFTPYRTLKIE